MSLKTIWEWIRSNGWPSQMIDTIAIKYYNENLSESVTHLKISIFANEVNGDFI
jgi:hypothetical protein